MKNENLIVCFFDEKITLKHLKFLTLYDLRVRLQVFSGLTVKTPVLVFPLLTLNM